MPHIASNGDVYEYEDVLHLYPALKMEDFEDFEDFEEIYEIPEMDDVIDRWEFRLTVK